MNFVTEINQRYSQVLEESRRQAKQYVVQNKLSDEDFKRLEEADPTKNKKYMGWMAKQWINKSVNSLDELINVVTEFNAFAEKGRLEQKDITSYKSFEELKSVVDNLNQQGSSISKSASKKDFEVIIDDENLYVVVPHTHAASRKLGMSEFACRNEHGDLDFENPKDSSWCTTYANEDHFNSYYYQLELTFYYIRVKSEELKRRLRQEKWITAIAIQKDGKPMFSNASVDSNNSSFNESSLREYLNVIGIEYPG